MMCFLPGISPRGSCFLTPMFYLYLQSFAESFIHMCGYHVSTSLWTSLHTLCWDCAHHSTGGCLWVQSLKVHLGEEKLKVLRRPFALLHYVSWSTTSLFISWRCPSESMILQEWITVMHDYGDWDDVSEPQVMYATWLGIFWSRSDIVYFSCCGTVNLAPSHGWFTIMFLGSQSSRRLVSTHDCWFTRCKVPQSFQSFSLESQLREKQSHENALPDPKLAFEAVWSF